MLLTELFVFLPCRKRFDMEKEKLSTRVLPLPIHPMEDDFRACAASLPLWRRRQAESFRFPVDRLQCAEAYLLLCRMLDERVGEGTLPRFAYGENGKPFLPDFPDVHFNLSHCPRAVMCAVADIPVGCDVEVVPTEIDEQLLRFCLSLDEQRRVLRASSPTVEFVRLWTRKEALLKLHGVGLIDDLPSLLSSPLARNVHFDTTVCDGYVYTTAVVSLI